MKSLPLALAVLALGISVARAQISGGATVVVSTPGPPSNSSGNSTTVQPPQPPPVDPTGAVVPSEATVAFATSQGETSLTLDVGIGIRYVPPSRVTVPVGERIQVTAPVSGAANARYTWLKNYNPIAGAPSSNLLVIDHVVSSDAGTYTCQTTTPASTYSVYSQELILGVGPSGRLLNISMRGALEAGPGKSFVAGFVVAGPGSASKKMIVRAVGPTLTRFGIEKPLAKPVLRIFDSAGRPYTNGYFYPAVVGGLTPETDLASSLAAVGAFPTPAGSADAVLLMPFPPGVYTAQVTSGDNGAGEVLIEIYEVP